MTSMRIDDGLAEKYLILKLPSPDDACATTPSKVS